MMATSNWVRLIFLPFLKVSAGPHVGLPDFMVSTTGSVDNHCCARLCRHTLAPPNGLCVTSPEAICFCCMYKEDMFFYMYVSTV